MVTELNKQLRLPNWGLRLGKSAKQQSKKTQAETNHVDSCCGCLPQDDRTASRSQNNRVSFLSIVLLQIQRSFSACKRFRLVMLIHVGR